MDLSFSNTSSNTRIVVSDSPGGTNISIFVPFVPNTDGTGHQRPVVELHCDGKEGAVDVASLRAESALPRKGSVKGGTVCQGGANPVARVHASVISSVSDSSAGPLGDGHGGERVKLASLPTMHQHLLAQIASEQTSLEANLSSRVSGGATHAVRDNQNADASDILCFKTAQELPAPRKVDVGQHPIVGPGLAEQRAPVNSGPIVDFGNASASSNHGMHFESDQPSAVAIDAVKVIETSVHMDVDVSAPTLDIYGDEHISEPLVFPMSDGNASVLSHDVSAREEKLQMVRESLVADPCVVFQDETTGKIAKVDLSLRRSTSAKANTGSRLGGHVASLTHLKPVTKTKINEHITHDEPVVNEHDKLHNKETVMNQTTVHKSTFTALPFKGIQKSVSKTHAVPTLGASQKGNPEVGRKRRQVQDHTKVLAIQAKNYAEEPSAVCVDKNATVVSGEISSLAKVSTAHNASGSQSLFDAANGVSNDGILAAATTGHQVRVEERWDQVRKLSADLKKENEWLKCEKAVLEKDNEALQKKVKELTKELHMMSLKVPTEAKGMKGTKKADEGGSQKKALPGGNPKPVKAKAKEVDPDGKQSRFMTSWVGAKRTADAMDSKVDDGTSNQTNQEQPSSQSNKKRKINTQNYQK